MKGLAFGIAMLAMSLSTWAGTCQSQTSQLSQLPEIRRAIAECSAIHQAADARYVSLIPVDTGWRRVDSLMLADAQNYITLLLSGNRVRSAALEEATPSGDWVQSTQYCFRTNNTLAFRHSTFSTFYGSGDVMVDEDIYYNSLGRPIRSATTIVDRESGRASVEASQSPRRRPPLFLSSDALLDHVGRANVFP